MASEGKGWGDSLGSLIAEVVGWGFCMALVAGFYGLGFWLAPYFGGAEHRDTFGVLAVIASIWMYEHQVAHDRWSKLLNK